MKTAPFYDDIVGAADPGDATWWMTSDGARIRLGVWNQDAPMGTVLIFPGRTEYIEKYAPTATVLGARGYSALVVDWRGQGLADRDAPDRLLGHVEDFQDYQLDVAAMVAAAKEMSLPEPYYLLGHSMGGCIALRALSNGLDVKAVCLTGPMWGINVPPRMRLPAWVLGAVAHQVGKGKTLSPGTNIQTYVLTEPYADNMLTSDRPTYEWLKSQVVAHPELALGGPSLGWLIEGLRECRDLAKLPSPNVPCLTFLGTNERVVRAGAIGKRMAHWPNGRLEIVAKAEHEILFETPETLDRVTDMMCEFFGENT
ncbi:alpha/beta fold hydrolase [Falsihalocynthiibacter sp. S25ZX9]|uniref:alpha/beta fold hydrolase n=1 Tax=Falsihalocynthiibacter sp. S25ZX9 TaxID=3240870 RepID=UPI00350F1922